MTLKSMTGFAREAGTTGVHRWAWEIKTVNGRGLDIRVRAPAGFDGVAEAARKQIASSLSRGQCALTLTLARGTGSTSTRINEDALAALVQALARIERPDGIAPASLDGLLGVRGVIEVDEDGGEAFDEALRDDLLAAAGRLVGDLQASRAAEGAVLGEVLAGQLSAMTALIDAAEACPARQPEAIRARLHLQVQALMEASQTLDPARLHQEAALLASKGDVREEIDRLRAHVAAARELLAAEGAVGRRLDFLAQEFGRETNTLCSKANDVSLSRIGLELKAVVEQFREQVQNVE